MSVGLGWPCRVWGCLLLLQLGEHPTLQSLTAIPPVRPKELLLWSNTWQLLPLYCARIFLPLNGSM